MICTYLLRDLYVAKSRGMSDKVVSLGGVSMLERVKWSRVVNNLYSVNRFEDVL